MKKTLTNVLLILQFFLYFSIGLYAQSTEIRPGIILPQMTTTQRTALSATNGMLVFDTNTQSYWLRSSGSWTELPKTAANTNFWQQTGLAGNEIKNTNSGGFWSVNPMGLSDVANNTTNPPNAPISGAGTRLMWIPSRSAFRVGTIADNSWDAANIGLFSFASGLNTKASGFYDTAMGIGAISNGEGATALGIYTKSNSTASTAMGNYTNASGLASTAMGSETNASGYYSTAMGNYTNASGLVSTAMGYGTQALGDYSTAMGFQSEASGYNSTTMGAGTKATGYYSTAMGLFTKAIGNMSTAMGFQSEASGYISTTMGAGTKATGDYSTAMGESTKASGKASTALGKYNVDNLNAILMVGNGEYGSLVNLLTCRADNNRVGIGVDDPIAHLHVGASGNVNTGPATFFYPNSTTLTHINNYSTYEVGIYANQGIMSNTFISAAQGVTASDVRIKNIINRSDNLADLDLLKKLQITNYRMKDEVTWGKQIFKKVIAQEVEKIYPEAVSKQTSVIPDIYALAEKVDYDANKKELSVSLVGNYNLKVGDKIELVHPEKGKVRTTISAVSGNTFTVKDWLYETDKIFVFGREVNDFRVIDYEALSMLGISAIQALAKENEELRKEISGLATQNTKLTTDFNARLSAIELLLKSTDNINQGGK